MITLFVLPLAWVSTAPKASAAELEGRLRERGTRAPISSVNVYILPHKLKGTTDAEGRFKISSVPPGPFTWVVNLAGYRKLEQPDEVAEDTTELEKILYVEKDSYDVYETTVFGRENKRDDVLKSLKLKDFISMPGSGGDPLKAVQNLPGIARPPAFAANVIIQGSAAADTRYTIDGHEVPIIFHFGGLSSVVIPEGLDRVDYLAAGYGSEWGRANGGLVGVWTRQPKTQRLFGFGYVDAFNAGGLLEGPLDSKSSFLVGFRQSYIGTVLGAVLPRTESLNFSVAPIYTDAVALYERKLTHRDDFKVVTAGSIDNLRFILSQPAGQDPAVRGNFNNQTAFFRIIPQWIHRHSERTTSRWSLGLGKDWILQDVGSNYFRLRNTSLTVRGELEKKLTLPWLSSLENAWLWTSQWGIDHRYNWSDVDAQLPTVFSQGGVTNPFSSGQVQTASVTGARTHALGLYWRNELKWAEDSKWTLIPALRGEYYPRSTEFFALPRLAARYQLDDFNLLRAATGLYSQPPPPQQQDATFGNPLIRSPRALHLSTAWERDWRGGGSRGFSTTVGGFYREFWNLIVSSSATSVINGTSRPEYFNNTGTGRAFGLETLVRLDYAPFTGWLAYTLSRSTRATPSTGEYLFSADQTHLLTAMLGVEPGKHFKIALRARFITGNPFTPVNSSQFDSDNDVYFPERGALYSQRLDPFFQLDLRVDKRFVFDTWVLSAYLDILNVTNQMNPETVSFAYDYSSNVKITGLPILPTIGLKAEF